MQTSANARVRVSFNHPCVELWWACRRQCQEKANNWFNFSGVMNQDPIKTATIFVNNNIRISRDAGYFRLVQPFQHHSNIPDAFIYCYSFALFPESAAPSGTCNFSRIDNVELQFELQEDLANEACTIIIYCRNVNVLRFTEGLAGVAFAN